MSRAPVWVRIPGSHHPGTRLRLVPGFRDPGSVLILGHVTQYDNPYLICIAMEMPEYCTKRSICSHYDDVIMSAMASQITSLTIVYSTVYSGADQRKHQSSALLALCVEFTGDRWIPRTKGQWRGKCFHLMTSSCCTKPSICGASVQYLLFVSNGDACSTPASSVSNHQPHDCLLNRLFTRRSKKTSKLRVTGLCERNSPVNSAHKGPVTRKMFPFDDVIMLHEAIDMRCKCTVPLVC